MSDYNLWWTAAALLVGAELLSGTFYLLVVGGGFALAGVVAWLGSGFSVQLGVAAVAAIGGVGLLRRWKASRPAAPARGGDLDLGHSVQVESWRDDGTARVSYRGSTWEAELADPAAPRARTMYIRALKGSRLVLTHEPPAG